jgi:predicted  nucleic acid-binding Zn-ribbon protein
MPLTGSDKTAYQREYMRRRRAKLRADKPPAARKAKPSATDAEVVRLQAEIAALQAEIAALRTKSREHEAELRRERVRREAAESNAAKAAPRDNKDDLIAELEKEIDGLRLHIRFGPKRRAAEAKPKPAQPRSQSEIEKGLRTRVRNLTAELRAARQHYEEEAKKSLRAGKMPFSTYAKLTTCLHPDKPPPSEKDRHDAFVALSQWKQASDRAR